VISAMIDLPDVRAAAERIAARVRRTPVLDLAPGAFGLDAHLHLKLESHQHTGSFKVRGAFNRLLAAEVPGPGVIAASGGNHGLAVAYAARILGVPAEIFVPATATPVKIDRLRSYGAHVTVVDGYYPEALSASRDHAAETGALVVHAYDQPEVVAGQGTLGLELVDRLPRLDTVIVAVGGGGLAAGVTTALAGRARVVAVETEHTATLHSALAHGGPVDVQVSGPAADALGAGRIGSIAYDVLSRAPVESVLVTDDEAAAGRQALWSQCRIAAELSAGAALAAITTGGYVPASGEHVALVICGGNTDPSTLTGP
jgi:threonine dehydratase